MSKKINPHYNRPSISLNMKIDMLNDGKKKHVIVGKFPCDPIWDKNIQNLIKSEILESQRKKVEPKHVENPRKFKKGMKRYKVYCKFSNEVLAYFYNTSPKLDGNYCDLHYVSWCDTKNWYGCKGININPETGEVNFESASGYAPKKAFAIVKEGEEPTLTNKFTEYIILEDKYPDDPTR